MTIPKITSYTGGVANPDGSQTQTEFTQNMFDQLSYEANLSTELNNTVDGINDTAIQVDATAVSAAQSAAAAEAAVSGLDYQGLWPDSGGSANKGDTWQTQTGGTPTGQYFTALQNTTIDPVSDNVNWREVVSVKVLDASIKEQMPDYTDIAYKSSGGNSAVENMISDLNNNPNKYPVGTAISTGDMSWVYSNNSQPVTSLSFTRLSKINVKDFEIGGVITSSASFSKLQDYIVDNSIKNVELIFPEKLTFNNPANYLTLDGLDNFVVSSLDVEDIHDYETTGNFIFTRMFDLTNTKNVSITNANAVSTLQSIQTDGEKKGFGFVRSIGGNTFTYSGSVDKCYRPFEPWNTDVVKATIYAENTRYAATAQKGCKVIDFNIKSKNCRRNFYVYSSGSTDIVVDSENQYGQSPLSLNIETDGESVEMSNVSIKFKERGSITLSGRAAPIGLNFFTSAGVAGLATARNIDIEYDVIGNYGTVINLAKYYDGNGDTQSRGYTIDGLNIHGRFKTPIEENTRLINYESDTNWHSGDFIQKFTFDDLTCVTDSAYNFSLNVSRVFDALNGDRALTFSNSLFNGGVPESSTIDYGKKVLFDKVELKTYSGYFSGESRKTLSKKDWVRGTSTASGISIKIADVDSERSYNFIDLNLKTHGNAESINSSWQGTINGYVSYDASGNPSVRVEANKLYENGAGVALNPTITANNSGELFLSLPEWTSATAISEAEVWLDVNLNYTQYTNIDNPYLVGLYSNKYDLPFGAGY